MNLQPCRCCSFKADGNSLVVDVMLNYISIYYLRLTVRARPVSGPENSQVHDECDQQRHRTILSHVCTFAVSAESVITLNIIYRSLKCERRRRFSQENAHANTQKTYKLHRERRAHTLLQVTLLSATTWSSPSSIIFYKGKNLHSSDRVLLIFIGTNPPALPRLFYFDEEIQ